VTAASTFGVTRYRAPVDAMLPVLAGGAIALIADRLRPKRAAADAPEPQPVLVGS
jgi:hypothetical protein